jgi:hypothetical protein
MVGLQPTEESAGNSLNCNSAIRLNQESIIQHASLGFG